MHSRGNDKQFTTTKFDTDFEMASNETNLSLLSKLKQKNVWALLKSVGAGYETANTRRPFQLMIGEWTWLDTS